MMKPTVRTWRMPRPVAWVVIASLGIQVPAVGCGYRVAGVPSLPQGVTTISFAEFENHTPEAGIEKELRWAFEREFRTYGGLRVSDRGEGILHVRLTDIYFRARTFDRRDQVLEYEAALAFDMQLTHRDSGEVLWQAKGIQVVEEASSVPRVAVTTSPNFLQGTLDPQDLSGFTDIQFAETQRRISLERLIREAAQAAYFRLGENF